MAVDPPERDERERRPREERGTAAGPGRSECHFSSRNCFVSQLMQYQLYIQVGPVSAGMGGSAVL